MPVELFETVASGRKDHQRIAGYLDILAVKRSCLSRILDGLVSEDVALLVDEALVTGPVCR
jgi:hypothetical protein